MPTAPNRSSEPIKQWQRKLADLEYAHDWRTKLPIDPDDDAAIDGYIDGDFGPQTLSDSFDLVEDFVTHDGDPKVARKAAAADSMVAAYRQLMETAS